MNKVDVVVTAVPRSGTSMMMQTLNILGKDLSYREEKNTVKNEQDKKRKDRAKELNPKNFYETPIVMKGFDSDNIHNYVDKTVKIMVTGLGIKSNIAGRIYHPIDHINKLILCLRHPSEIEISKKRLVSGALVASDKEWAYSPEKMEINVAQYINSMGRFLIYLYDHKTKFDSKLLSINYSDMVTNPGKSIKGIAGFVNVTNKEFIKNAIDNIDTSLYRSKQSDEWENILDRKLAEKIYYSLLENDITSSLVEELTEYYKRKHIENNSQWLDVEEFETMCRIGASMYRSLKINNNNVRTKLQEISQKSKTQDMRRCKYYSLSDDEYTIPRPSDIGDLVRKKIMCKRDDNDLRSYEQCFICWNKGCVVKGIKMEAQRGIK